MNPLILKFVEEPKSNIDIYPDLHYDEDLNLSVIRDTNFIVIDSSLQSTMTQTRAQMEGSDSDPMRTFCSLTATRTLREARESTDSDR